MRREERVGLPLRNFLYTIDQIAALLEVDEPVVRQEYLYYYGRTVGTQPMSKMMARNIAPDGEKPEWRVTDRELGRWLAKKGFRVYTRGWTTH